MKHIIMYSGGIGSWATARRVIDKYGKQDVVLLFTDTLIEDEDLYRFLEETVKDLGCEYYKIADGRDPWEIFKHKRYLGNSRQANCSHILKQDLSRKWIEANFKPDECVLYLGIDWTEVHRTAAPTRNWLPYKVEFPMCDEPYVAKDEMLAQLAERGIEIPRLYKLGFSHNNCGGFCVRAGQGHFAKLLETMPDRYAYHEQKEQEMRDFLGKDVSILRRQRNGEKERLTLRQLREELQSGQDQNVDREDFGGCGCFVTDETE